MKWLLIPVVLAVLGLCGYLAACAGAQRWRGGVRRSDVTRSHALAILPGRKGMRKVVQVAQLWEWVE